MNAIVKAEPQKMMLLEYMADRYDLIPDEFSKTVRATCGLATATPEQFAAFLIVAKQYNLNPLTKEIYAFPGRGGGVVPIVSIDGWVNLVNSHPQCDGFDMVAELDQTSALLSYTCTMYRKDRSHPVVVTEYLSECVRTTEPWKMKHRMLRHKALIQAARYAFGFAGIYDEDEGRVIADADAPPRDAAPPRNIKTIEHQPAEPEIGSHISGDPVDDIPASEQVVEKVAALVPRDVVPQQGDTFEAWAKRYIAALETSPDTAVAFKWIDLNQARLKKLEGSPEWTSKVKKATAALIQRLRPDAAQITSGPQGEPQADMGGDVAPKADKPPRGRPKASKAPHFDKDYDGWVAFYVKSISEAVSVDQIEELFAVIESNWGELFPPDKAALDEARSAAEERLAP